MVESIVIEERKAKETMPIFKGLEDYRLEEKMGESVSFFLLVFLYLLSMLSGAFSNVFKATELSTTRRVAGLYSSCRSPSVHSSPFYSQSRTQI
jgi:hypothetical protein